MTAKSILPNPEEKDEKGNEETQTPDISEKGTEGDSTPEKELKGDKLPPEPVDYKKKFSDSTREAQRLVEDAKTKDERIAELEVELQDKSRSAPPSEEELAKTHPDWDLLDPNEKQRIKREESTSKRVKRLEEELAWEKDFKSLIKQDGFTSLAKEEDEFRKFAYKYPKEVELLTLAKSYLYGRGTKAEPEEVPEKRIGLEEPSGGDRQVPTNEMTLEDITRLRKDQPRKYLEMIRAGKLKNIPKK